MKTTEAGQQRAILFDLNLCAGCNKCVAACQLKQGFARDEDDAKERAKSIEKLSDRAYTALGTVVNPEDEDETWSYRQMCKHCIEPSCASVCPVAAIEKTELGPVVYDADKCMGCRYCLTACPFNVPKYEWHSAVPAVRKCDMCYDRQKEGEEPACAEACPYGATISGTREEMLEEARERIADDPESYHPHIYGEHEVGGTSVLVLSPVPIDELLGFNAKLGNEPVPVHTWKVLSKVPSLAVFAGATMTALWWLTNRRDEVKAFEAAEKAKKQALNGGDGSRGSTEGNGHA